MAPKCCGLSGSYSLDADDHVGPRIEIAEKMMTAPAYRFQVCLLLRTGPQEPVNRSFRPSKEVHPSVEDGGQCMTPGTAEVRPKATTRVTIVQVSPI